MQGESQANPVGKSVDFRSFAVEAVVGHRAGSWPFARFDISVGELRVRLSFPWFTTSSQQAATVTAVVVSRRVGDVTCIRFDDAVGKLADVHVHALYRIEQIIGELRHCGYQVIDCRAQETSRWRLRHP